MIAGCREHYLSQNRFKSLQRNWHWSGVSLQCSCIHCGGLRRERGVVLFVPTWRQSHIHATKSCRGVILHVRFPDLCARLHPFHQFVAHLHAVAPQGTSSCGPQHLVARSLLHRARRAVGSALCAPVFDGKLCTRDDVYIPPAMSGAKGIMVSVLGSYMTLHPACLRRIPRT